MSSRYVWERYSQNTSYSLSWSTYRPSGVGIPIGSGTWMLARSCSISASTGSVSFSGSRAFNGSISADDYPYLYRSGYTSGTGIISLYRASTQGSGGQWSQIGVGSDTQAYVNSSNLDHYSRASISRNITQGSLLGYNSSASSGAYPSNGSSGSNWYVYQGSDTIDPAAVSLPASIFGGDTVTATVTPSAGKVYGGTVTYTWQYRLDGGAWQSLASGTAATQQLTVPAGTNTVEVQVRANDDLGFTSSTWVSSGAVSVTNNLPPSAPGSIDVTAPVAGQPLTVTLTAATDPDGTVAAYVIERWVDSVYGGYWLQVQNSAALTFTETVGADWQSVQYRAAAVDDEGAQGPYIESGTLPVSTGAVTLTGPASGQGEHAQPFDLGPITLGVTPAPSDPAVQLTVLLDGAETVRASQAAGDEITLRVDPRVMARGAHTITVTASKEAYTTAMAQYTYTVPAWDGSDIAGGKSGRFEDHLGNKLLPKTLAQDSLGPGGADMATLIAEAQAAAAAAPLEPVVRAAPPSGSYALSPGVLYDFTQADASALTFTFTAPEAGKAAAYHVMFKCGSTAATVTLPEGVKTPDGYVIEAGRVYELSVLEGLLTYQSWEADA